MSFTSWAPLHVATCMVDVSGFVYDTTVVTSFIIIEICCISRMFLTLLRANVRPNARLGFQHLLIAVFTYAHVDLPTPKQEGGRQSSPSIDQSRYQLLTVLSLLGLRRGTPPVLPGLSSYLLTSDSRALCTVGRLSGSARYELLHPC